MSNTTVTNVGYTGTVQNATVTGEYGIPVNAYLWGAGGGSTSQAAGNAGGYSKVYFVAKPGDKLTVAVGQGGGRGGSDINGWTPSGFSGAAYSGLLFNTRFPPPGQDTAVVPYGQGLRNTSSSSTSFLSQWGVWGADQNVQTFTRTYTINFPTTANVIFQMVASTYGRVYLDSVLLLVKSPPPVRPAPAVIVVEVLTAPIPARAAEAVLPPVPPSATANGDDRPAIVPPVIATLLAF